MECHVLSCSGCGWRICRGPFGYGAALPGRGSGVFVRLARLRVFGRGVSLPRPRRRPVCAAEPFPAHNARPAARATPHRVMFCHGPVATGAYAVVLSGMEPASRPGFRGLRPVVPASRLQQGRFVLPVPAAGPPVQRNPLPLPPRPHRASPWPDTPPLASSDRRSTAAVQPRATLQRRYALMRATRSSESPDTDPDKGSRCDPLRLIYSFIHAPNTQSTIGQSKTSRAVTFCHVLSCS